MKQRRENNPQFSYQNVMKFPVSFHSNVVKKVERHENLLKKDEHRENVGVKLIIEMFTIGQYDLLIHLQAVYSFCSIRTVRYQFRKLMSNFNHLISIYTKEV